MVNPNRSKHDNSQNKRRPVKSLVVGGNSSNFSSGGKGGKGGQSYAEFKLRREKHFTKNARLLRQYKKTMKTEGYDAGLGGSRRRENAEEEDYHNHDEQKQGKRKLDGNSEVEEDGNGDAKQQRKKRVKKDPFARAQKLAEMNRQKRIEDKKEMEKQQQNLEENLEKRKRRAKVARKRTNRGQPIMKNVIGDILEKLQKERDEQS